MRNQDKLCFAMVVMTAVISLSDALALTRPAFMTRANNVRSVRSLSVLRMTAREDPAYYRRPVVNDILSSGSKGLSKTSCEDDGFQELGFFEVLGQGAVGFKMIPEVDTLNFRFCPPSNTPGHTIECKIDGTGWTTTDTTTGTLLGSVQDPTLLHEGYNRTFWMSFDKENCVIRCGIGYMLTALEKFNVTFGKDDLFDAAFYRDNYSHMTNYSMYKPAASARDRKIDLVKSKYPIYRDLPPIIKDHDDMRLEDLESGEAISMADLSPECQRLYSNVAGMAIQLDTPDFPDFSAAIDHSIQSETGICAIKLKEKAKTEFIATGKGHDAHQTYLRVTLGTNQGDSPGIPYVMEIWPPACYSPIHDHGGTNAIIKVLHGSLTTRWFTSLYEVNEKPYAQGVVAEGQVTWLDDRQFQTHQLFNHNVNGTACVTIQCYLYNDDDNRHYENFDYIGGDDEIHPFVPDSDWGFADFKEKMRKEWDAYKQTAVPVPKIFYD
jgi:hypothetical protein